MRVALCAALAVLAACEGVSTSPQPIVSVLKRLPQGCFEVITMDTSPPDPALGIGDVCSSPADTPGVLLANDDFVELVVDYGPDVEFASSTVAPPPTITLVVDGQPSGVTITVGPEQRVGARAFFVATFLTPAPASLDVRIVAGVNPGFQTTVPDVFRIEVPFVEIALVDCAIGTVCTYTGSVGSAHVRVSVVGDTPQLVALGMVLDGVAQPPPGPPIETQFTVDHTEHMTAIPVPAARDGAQWLITAQLDGGTPSAVLATIAAPAIATALSCGTACAAGQPAGLTITAPGLIRPLEALVTTYADGVPQLVAAPVELFQQADGSAVGNLALVAPSAGTWQVDATIAGYAAPALITAVH
jgi:hypothetical protein